MSRIYKVTGVFLIPKPVFGNTRVEAGRILVQLHTLLGMPFSCDLPELFVAQNRKTNATESYSSYRLYACFGTQIQAKQVYRKLIKFQGTLPMLREVEYSDSIKIMRE